MIKITLKDGSVMESEAGISIYEIAKKISERLAKVATSALLNDEVVDLRKNKIDVIYEYLLSDINDEDLQRKVNEIEEILYERR